MVIKPQLSNPIHPVTVPQPTSISHPPNHPLFLPFAALALLFLLIRLGPFSFLLLLLVAALLAAHPDFRAIIDAAFGSEPPSHQRLLLSLPNLAILNNSSLHPDLSLNSALLSSSQHISLLPPQLYASFSALFDLIIRDFVANWYLLPAISTGDQAFLSHTRAALDHVLVKAYQKISSKSSKETMVYLIGCLSMNLVRRINQRAQPNPPSKLDKLAQRKLHTQSISREILLTLGPPAVTLSPLTLSLLVEIMTVQLVGFTDSFDDHWFCQSIITALGTAPQVSPEAAHEIEQSVEQVARQEDSQPAPNLASENLPAASNDPAPPDSSSGNQILSHYLKNLPSLDRASRQAPAAQPQLVAHWFANTPCWTPSQPPSDAELDQLISQPAPNTEHATLIKIAIQLNSFCKIVQTAGLEPEMVKSDAIALLSALSTPMAVAMDAIQAREPDPARQEYLASGWRAVAVETLRRLEADQADGEAVFGNLQEWIVERLRPVEAAPKPSEQLPPEPEAAKPGEQLPPEAEASKPGEQAPREPEAAPKPDEQSPREPNASAKPGDLSPRERVSTPGQDRISYMTLPTIPGPGSRSGRHGSFSPQAHTPDDGSMVDPWETSVARSSSGPGTPSAPDSHDLGSIGTEGRWTKATSAATDAVLARHRPPSFTGRASGSPGGSDWGASPRQSVRSEPHTFSSPQPMGRAQGYRIPSEVPEEGDMAEGYSLEEESEAGWSGDMGASMLEQAPAARRSVSSISSLEEPQQFVGRTPRAPDAPLGPSKPFFSVTLTDMSPRTITDPKTGLLKQKKDLELLVAVESSQQDVPSFIVTRKWHEFEKLDSELNKLKLIGLGTPQFPRALLPSGFLGVKTVDQVLREGEGYLMNLLNEDRYARSAPVSKFFAKERSGMSHSRTNTIGTMILGSTTSTLDVIGKGVASVGKEVVSKPADLAAGFNRFSKGVFAGLPFGSGSGSTPAVAAVGGRDEGGEEKVSVDERRRLSARDRATTLPSAPPSAPPPAPAPAPAPEPRVQDVPVMRKDPGASVQLGGEASAGGEEAVLRVSPPRAKTDPAPVNVAQSPVAKTRVAPAAHRPGGESVASGPAKLSKPTPVPAVAGGAGLTGADFDAVIVGMMAVLEAAYGLESSGTGVGSAWSVKRGVLRVVETVLRTTSVGGAVRKGVGEWAGKMEVVETYVEQVDGIREALWPGGKWAGGGEEEEEKKQDEKVVEEERQKERELARKLFVESWASLKIGLGSHDTEVAAQKVFETFVLDDGCLEIVHGLVLDLIRIVLLL